jgi:hypothetical protein
MGPQTLHLEAKCVDSGFACLSGLAPDSWPYSIIFSGSGVPT